MLVEYETKRKDTLLIVLKLCLCVIALYMLQYYMPLLYEKMVDSRATYEEPMLRVIAHSNTEANQQIKWQMVKDLQEIHYIDIENTRIIEHIQKLLTENYTTIHSTIKTGDNLVPPGMYNGVFYPQMYAKSVAVIIGDGRGENWFCSVFPKVCGKEDSEKVRFEWWEWLKEKWS